MSKIVINFRCLKYNDKTGKWDVKFLIDGKVKWMRGFTTESEAYECTKSYEPKNKSNNK